jgi:hypothetical protein
MRVVHNVTGRPHHPTACSEGTTRHYGGPNSAFASSTVEIPGRSSV